MGDSEHEAPRECRQPTAGRRDRCRLGRLYDLDRSVTRSCQCGGGRIQACRRSERWRVFGRGRTEEVWRCAGRFERAVTMVLLLRDDREPRLDLPCRRATLLGSSTSSTSPVSSCAAAMQRFSSDGSNSGHGGCALETALLDRQQSLLRPAFEAAPPVATRAAGEQSRLVSRDRAHQVESKDGRDVPRLRRARRTASPAGANDSSAVVENRGRSGGPNRRRRAMALRRNRPS